MKDMFIFRANVNTATMKIKKWDGEDYLVGPVIMAREIVMNRLFYPESELKASVPHWNGRPVVNSHPKDKDGNYTSANTPEILNASGLGFVFNTGVDKKKRLTAQLWINLKKLNLEAHSAIKTKIDEGEMLEVSTGVFVARKEQAGDFDGREYDAIAFNHKPDHLAILPNETGACSVADGAGFPRVNSLEVNELSGGDKYSILARAVRRKYSSDGNSAFLEDTFDDRVIYNLYSYKDGGYILYSVEYTIGADEQTVTFKGTPKKVILKRTYVDSVETNVLQTSSTTEAIPETNTNGEKRMKTRKEIVAELLAGNRVTPAQATVLESMSEEQFEVYKSLLPHQEAQTTSTDEGAEGDVEKEEEEEAEEIEDNKNRKGKTKPAIKPLKANKGDDDITEWAQKQYASARNSHITTIMGNSANSFTKTELEGLPIATLEKMASIAGNASDTDMSAAATPVKTQIKANQKKVTPYVPAHMRPATK